MYYVLWFFFIVLSTTGIETEPELVFIYVCIFSKTILLCSAPGEAAIRILHLALGCGDRLPSRHCLILPIISISLLLLSHLAYYYYHFAYYYYYYIGYQARIR